MKYASVCSGVEAASLAWMPLGWEAVWFSEIEPFPCAVLQHRFPNVPNLGDMTKIRVETLENGDQNYYGDNGTVAVVPGGVDLLVGGTPCQGFSVAGKQGGLEDDRSALCLTFVRLLKEMRPRFFVWENVPGVLSTAGGADFFEFIRQITESGYCCAWRILDAQYVRVDGFPRAVPQRRRRMFVVGCLGADWELPAKILFEPQSLLGDNPPRRVKGKGFTADVERSVGETGRAFYMKSFAKPVERDALTVTAHIHKGISNESPVILDNQTALSGVKDATPWDGKDVAGTLKANSFHDLSPHKGKMACVCLNDLGGSVMNVEEKGTAGCLPANTHGNEQIVCVHGAESPVFNLEERANPVTANHNGLENCVCERLIYSHDIHVVDQGAGKSSCSVSIELSPTLATTHGGEPAVAIAENIIGRQLHAGGNGPGAQEDLAYTQNTSGVMGVAHNQTVRRLLPVECERLMGFQDNWTKIPYRGKSEEDCPDSPRYKACGNSMCVNVMRWIGKRIDTITKGETK